MLLGICIYMFAVSLAVHLPINYPLVYWLALIAPLAWNRRNALACVSRVRLLFMPVRFKAWTGHPAFEALVFVLLSHCLLTPEPEILADALAMHLGIPWKGGQLHQLAFRC